MHGRHHAATDVSQQQRHTVGHHHADGYMRMRIHQAVAVRAGHRYPLAVVIGRNHRHVSTMHLPQATDDRIIEVCRGRRRLPRRLGHRIIRTGRQLQLRSCKHVWRTGLERPAPQPMAP